jgi:pyruvate formate lyase activating enzyme
VIFLEYAIDVVGACHQAGVKAVAVTAGYMCAEPRAELFRHVDAANVDLKGFTGDFYRRTCLAGLDPVLETLLYLRHETGVWLEITTLLIPGLNDSDAEIDAMTRWWPGSSARTCRCTSPRSTRTSRCGTARPRRRRR